MVRGACARAWTLIWAADARSLTVTRCSGVDWIETDEEEEEDEEGDDAQEDVGDGASRPRIRPAAAAAARTTLQPPQSVGTLLPCAIKVYKTSLNEFKNREVYMRDDWRFDRRIQHGNPRRVIAVSCKSRPCCATRHAPGS